MSTALRTYRSLAAALSLVAVSTLAAVAAPHGDGLAEDQPGPAGFAYVANEATSTISVIDTATQRIASTICLGSSPGIQGTPQPGGPCNAERDHHQPFYNGHVDTHGLWLTPDGSILLAANRISGTVVAVDTTTGAVLGYAPTGREPHLATVSPNGTEAWVAVRGEAQIEILRIDPDTIYNTALRPTDRLPRVDVLDTVHGPSMISFTSDGQSAFVVSGKEPRVEKIDVATRRVVASQPVPAAFTPFGLVSPEDRELYVVHKGTGQLSILRTDDLSVVVEGLPIGPRANHVFFVGPLAYVTIGGPLPSEGNADPAGKVVVIDRMTHQIVHELTGPAWTGEPHAIWATPDGSRLYVGHERGSRVTVLDVGSPGDPTDDRVVGTVTGSAFDLGFLKKPIDIVIRRLGGTSTE